MAVYIFTNKINQKRYIGKTAKALDVRINWHRNAAKRGVSSYFHRSLYKHGWDNFSIEVVSESIEENFIDKLEIFLIDRFNTYRYGYNLTKGGDGTSGYKQSPEHIAARVKSQLGKPNPGASKYNKEKAKKFEHKGKNNVFKMLGKRGGYYPRCFI